LHVVGMPPVSQLSVQPAPAQVQVDEPSQLTVHLPLQVTTQVLLPMQVTLELSPTVSVQVLVPWQWTVVLAPPVSVQAEPPPHSPLLPEPSDCAQLD
jgi:hypothetical protein